MKLNQDQIEIIKQELAKVEIYYKDIQDELLDHVASETEKFMQEGQDFSTAFQQAALSVNPEKFQMDVLIATHLSKAKRIFKSCMEPMIFIKSILLAGLILAVVHGLGLEASFAHKLIKGSFVAFVVIMALVGFKQKLLKNSKVVASGNSLWLIICLVQFFLNYDLMIFLGLEPWTISALTTAILAALFVSGLTLIVHEAKKLKLA